MKVEWRLSVGAAVFLLATAAVYWAIKYNPTESAGVACLLFGGFAYAMLFGYLLLQYMRRHRIPRPEDRFDATPSDPDAVGEVGYFPAASIWPAGMGIGMTLAGVGAIFGFWYLIIGAVLFIGSVIGYVVEAEAPE
jgi:hypothetical protein